MSLSVCTLVLNLSYHIIQCIWICNLSLIIQKPGMHLSTTAFKDIKGNKRRSLSDPRQTLNIDLEKVSQSSKLFGCPWLSSLCWTQWDSQLLSPTHNPVLSLSLAWIAPGTGNIYVIVCTSWKRVFRRVQFYWLSNWFFLCKLVSLPSHL